MLKSLFSAIWRRVPASIRRWTVRFTNTRFTVTAGAVIFDTDGNVLLLKHLFRAGSGWGLPGGFLKPGEQPLEALQRELQEEIGLKIQDVEFFWARSFKRPRQVEILFRAKASGQPRPQSIEVERAVWFSPNDLPSGLPENQKLLVARAVEKQRV
jgi:8-oxo-dGTP diphosphatase